MTLEESILNLHLPSYNELEITTIGAGCYEGESIVIHLGNGEWAIIDSCMSLDMTCLPLFYLENLGVCPEQVKHVICTHWHTDHIKGMSEILRKCQNASFWYPVVGQKNNLLKYIIAGNLALKNKSVWSEFVNCFKSVPNIRKNYLLAGTMIYDDNGIVLSAISPSEKMLDIQFELLKNLDINDKNDASKVNDLKLKPNLCCSALFLRSDIANVIIGADLEANRNNKVNFDSCLDTCNSRWEKGWCHVIMKSVPLGKRSYSYIKLPHHSSATGYCDALWKAHADKEVTSVSTVFINNAGVKLPQKEMLEKYFSLSKDYFMTGPSPKKKEKINKSRLGKADLVKPLAVFSGDKGFVCSRKKAGKSWVNIPLGAALLVDQKFINEYQ